MVDLSVADAAYTEDVTAQPIIDPYTVPGAVGIPTVHPSYRVPVPRLRPWSRTWRYLAAAGIGLVLWVAVSADYLAKTPESVPPEFAGAIGGLLLLDLLLGALALCILPLRRRRPVLIAALTASFSAVSASCLGAAALATVSMSTRRRWRIAIFVGAVWVVSTLVYEMLLRPSVPGIEPQPAMAWASGGLAIAVYGICVATGFYVGARRDLVVSLHERADNAEREQALKAKSAREAERTRIAREMHDVLAHRISLVALHAGVLTYRTDLTREETAQAAGIIQDNAHLALVELRQVLGVLRGGQLDEGGAEPPQPTLAEIPALLADAGEAGTDVTLDITDMPELNGRSVPTDLLHPVGQSALAGLSGTVSRTAYRIIQEALTNARKHAPSQPVRIRLGQVDGRLQIEVRNVVVVATGGMLGAGVGLAGLRERAGLAGGSLEHCVEPDNTFVVKAWLPWE